MPLGTSSPYYMVHYIIYVLGHHDNSQDILFYMHSKFHMSEILNSGDVLRCSLIRVQFTLVILKQYYYHNNFNYFYKILSNNSHNTQYQMNQFIVLIMSIIRNIMSMYEKSLNYSCPRTINDIMELNFMKCNISEKV